MPAPEVKSDASRRNFCCVFFLWYRTPFVASRQGQKMPSSTGTLLPSRGWIGNEQVSCRIDCSKVKDARQPRRTERLAWSAISRRDRVGVGKPDKSGKRHQRIPEHRLHRLAESSPAQKPFLVICLDPKANREAVAMGRAPFQVPQSPETGLLPRSRTDWPRRSGVFVSYGPAIGMIQRMTHLIVCFFGLFSLPR